MSREINQDYESLEKFISEYQLEGVLNEDFILQLKPIHKRLFALMTITAEIEHHNKTHKVLPTESLIYLKESVSDIGQALFCWVLGAYKPALLIVRSSIETFVKSISFQEIPDILNEKSMYNVFDEARKTSFFSSGLGDYYFQKIHSEYKDLCKTVHSADQSKMAHINALKTFPIFTLKDASNVSKNIVNILTSLISLLYVCFFTFIPLMHPKNQINFLSTIPKSTKQKINDQLR